MDLAIIPANPPAIRLRISLGKDWMAERAKTAAVVEVGGVVGVVVFVS